MVLEEIKKGQTEKKSVCPFRWTRRDFFLWKRALLSHLAIAKRTLLRKGSFVFMFISLETKVSARSHKNKSLNKVEAFCS